MNDFIELRRVISTILRWWWLPVILTLIGAVLGYSISQRQRKVYQATTTLLVGQSIFATELDRQDILANDLVALSYRELVQRQPVMQAVVDALNLGQSWQQLRRQVRAELVEGTQLIQIAVEAGDPGTAQIIADEVARQTILFSPVELSNLGGEDTRRFLGQQLESLQARIENGQNRLAQLQIELVTTSSTERLSELQDEITTLEGLITEWESNYTQLLVFWQSGQLPNKLTVIEPAQANRNPIRPQVQLYILVGGGMGFFLAIGLIFLIEYLDDTLRSAEDVTREFGLPVLGSIVNVRRSGNNPIGVYVSRHPRSPIAEGFRLLRANLELVSADQPLRSLLITSCDKGVGKSSVSTNLAIIMAHSDREIILVDADLRKSSVHVLMSLPNELGLSEILSEDIDISEALQTSDDFIYGVITGGKLPPNPSELLGSRQMDQVLVQLEEIADMVIIDAPPLIVSDALVLSTKVDGVLMVVRPGHTHKKFVRTTMEQLDRAGARVIGVVLNAVTDRSARYYGAYPYPPGEFKDGRYSSDKWGKADGWFRAAKRIWSNASGVMKAIVSDPRVTRMLRRVRGGDLNGIGPEQLAKAGGYCLNEDCPDFEKPQSETQKNIRKAGKSKKGVQRYHCKTCGKTFSETVGTIFFRKRTPENDILEILALIAEGNPVSDISREKGFGKDTIDQWLQEAAQNQEQVNETLINDFKVEPGQLDALWTDVLERSEA